MLADLERLRDASDDDRPALLEALERAHGTGAAAERARAACTEAYRALQESTTLESSVRKRLGALAAASAAPTTAAPATATPSSRHAPGPDAGAPEPSRRPSDAGRPTPLGPDTDRIVEDLGRAERELDRAKEKMPECEQALAALRMVARGSAER